MQRSLQLSKEKHKDNLYADTSDNYLKRLFGTKKVNKVTYKRLPSFTELVPTQSQEKWIADYKLENAW